MPDQKVEILSEFEVIIADLEALIAKIPPVVNDRYSRGNEGGYISPENLQVFFEIRTRTLKLLSRIDSEDTSLKNTVNYIRDIDVILFNIKSMLHQLQGLRSDYEADILTLHPRLPEIPIAAPVEKRRWLDEPKAIIIGSFITAIAAILAVLLGIWIDQTNNANTLSNNAVIFTFTPSAATTITATNVPTVETTPEITLAP